MTVRWEKPSISNCEACPLKEQPYCPPELNPGATETWIGESPGGREVLVGRPFVGRTGRRLDKDARLMGLQRSRANVFNSVQCRPLKIMTDSRWSHAVKACAAERKRLLDLNNGPILAAGKWALNGVTGHESIEKWYAYPLRYNGRMVMPAPHPSRVMRQPWWAEDWLECLRRFRDIRNGKWKEWVKPPLHWRGADWWLANKIDALSRDAICIDAETAGVDPQFSKTICYGLSDGREAVTLIWPPGPLAYAAFKRVIWEADRLVAHNAQHDLLVLEQLGIPYREAAVEDTLHQHAILEPEMPHNLGIATARRWRQPRWKSIHDDEAPSWDTMLTECLKSPSKMDELCEYNGLDCYNGANLFREQRDELRAAKPNKQETYDLLRQRGWVAQDMRRRGIRVDMVAREAKLDFFATRARRAHCCWHALTKREGWPETPLGKKGTTGAVERLFFEHFELYPLAFTDGGNPSLDAWTLQRWASGVQADRKQARAARLLLKYRTSMHMFGMVESLYISPDGRVHPAWNPWGALTDRWSCGKPNLMNLPKHGLNNLRTLFVPDHGYTFVVADADKVELRVIAILAGDKPLLAAFERGEDVHQRNAIDLFGPGATKQQRDFGKRFAFGANYGASAETLWRTLVVQYPKVELKAVAALLKQWFRKHPAIKNFLAGNLEGARTTGVLTPGVGPRSWEFYEGQVDPNEVYNRPIQATVAWVINRALCRLYDEGFQIPWQCHDEISLHVPVYRKWAAAESLVNAMTEEVELVGQQWVLPAEPEQGDSWGTPRSLQESP